MICIQCTGSGNLFFIINGNRVWMKCEWCEGTGVFNCECLKVNPHMDCRGTGIIQIKQKIKNTLTWDQCQEIDGTDFKKPNQQKKKC